MHWLVRIVAISLLVAVVTGCGGAGRYDARLVAADSLMQPDPDSALALVQAVPPGSLTREGDRAYRDLLLTQARYKCYITATSDSDINRALDYYRRHSGEREKLTRAYIYKGAVMEELGHPDSAMFYYKHAEATAAPDDYFNLGYVNLRIAELYQSMLGNDTAVVGRMKKANHYFLMTKDTSLLITATGTLGSYSKIIGKDSSRLFLNQAIQLANTINSPKVFQYQSKLAGSYFYDGDYRQAKELAMGIFRKGRNECNENQFYFYAARSYIRLNLLDSARWLIEQIPTPHNAVDSMNLYQTLAEISQAVQDYENYAFYNNKAKSIDTRIIEASRDPKLNVTELKWEADQNEGKIKSQANYRLVKIFCVIVLVIALLMAFFYSIIKNRMNHYQSEINNTRTDLEKLLSEIEQYRLNVESERQDFISQIEEKENELAVANRKNRRLELEQGSLSQKVADIVRHRHSAINELYQSIRIKSESDKDRKRPLLLMSTIRELYEKRGILQTPPSQSFWDNLRYSVEGEYQGIVSFVEQHYPNLTNDDIKLFMLCCAGIPNKIIKICMDYTSDVTVSKNKRKLLKEKFNVDVRFDGFIQMYLRGELPV